MLPASRLWKICIPYEDEVAGIEIRMALHCAFSPLHESNAEYHSSVSEESDSCRTPDGKQGQCIDLKSCPVLLSLLTMTRPLPSEVIDFLRNSQCGFKGKSPLVCCPVPPPSTTAATKPTVEEPPDVSSHPNLRLLPLNICGPVSTSKIFNGNRTALFQYPWMALIRYNKGN
jgi:transmembrane serine protease 9